MAGCLVNHPPAYVFDTGPLSHFARGGWLGALEFLVGDSSAWIPEAVARELTDGQHQHQHLLRTARYEQRLAAGGRNHGECAVLALAAVRGWTAVIDDSEARKIAHEDSIDYTTTVRLLCQAISAGKMTATSCAAIVDALVRTEYRLPFDSGQDFLRWASREGIVDYEATRAEGE
jgi:predicted nucleic acid-binding protein